MIYDSINNIEIFKGLSDDIYEGLKFLKNASPDLSCDVYEINSRVKAIVSEYETKSLNEYGYEAHRKFIDIQYLIKGTEKSCCLPIEKLTESKPYDKESDTTFFTAKMTAQELILGNGYFAIFYPQDGHMPQLCVDKPVKVKKIVVKVEVKQRSIYVQFR